MISFEESEL